MVGGWWRGAGIHHGAWQCRVWAELMMMMVMIMMVMLVAMMMVLMMVMMMMITCPRW